MNKNRICGIYKITSPTGKIYIGQSRNVYSRRNKYRNCKPDQPRIYNSIQKYGWEAHTFEIIEECKIEDLNRRERYWQDFYDVLGEFGLNCSLTAADEKVKIYTKEMSLVVSANTRGENNPNYGKVMTQETKDRISKAKKESGKAKGENNPMWGKKGEDHPNFGRKQSQEEIEKRASKMRGENHFNSKIVLDTQTGIFFYSVREAAETYGIKKSTLAHKLRGLLSNNTNLIYV